MGKFKRTAGAVATGASGSLLQLKLSDDLFCLMYLIFAYFSKKWGPGEAQGNLGLLCLHTVVNGESLSSLLLLGSHFSLLRPSDQILRLFLCIICYWTIGSLAALLEYFDLSHVLDIVVRI